jgi:penicillin V acylase-like amidase (Ntn superfamily)
VTFNVFGRDLPDGGINEDGLYIWEMNEEADYQTNDSLAKLNQMHWMQYILDNYPSDRDLMRTWPIHPMRFVYQEILKIIENRREYQWRRIPTRNIQKGNF